jgi:hypothetical protein
VIPPIAVAFKAQLLAGRAGEVIDQSMLIAWPPALSIAVWVRSASAVA